MIKTGSDKKFDRKVETAMLNEIEQYKLDQMARLPKDRAAIMRSQQLNFNINQDLENDNGIKTGEEDVDKTIKTITWNERSS